MRPALPIPVKFSRQPVCNFAILYPQHHIVPGKIVIREVDSAKPHHVVHHQQLLVIASGIGKRIGPHRIGDPELCACRYQRIEHGPRRLGFGLDLGITCQREEAIIDDMAGVIIDQHAAISGGALPDGMGNAQPCRIAFKRHRLNQHSGSRRRHIAPR